MHILKENKIFFYCVGCVIPVSQVLGYWDNLGKLGPNTLNHVQRHTKSNPKDSVIPVLRVFKH